MTAGEATQGGGTRGKAAEAGKRTTCASPAVSVISFLHHTICLQRLS